VSKASLLTAVKYAFLSLVAFAFIFPLYFMTSVSLSSKPIIESGGIIPDLYLGNWADFFDLWQLAIRNSIIISLSCIGVTLLVSFPAAYAFSRFKFMADKHLFFWFLTNRMAPPICFVLPFLIMFKGLGLWDTIPGIVLAYCLFNVPIGIWLLASFMSGIPREIDDAAFIDGWSVWSYWKRVFIPANKPGIAVTAFFIWMFSWTEMLMASVLTSTEAKPLTVYLLITMGRVGYGVQYGLAAAAGVFTMIPGLVLFYWVRNYLAKGFTFGRL